MNRIALDLCGVKLQSPTIVASGILGISASSAWLAVSNGAGAVTMKSCGLEPRHGHPCPTILPFEAGLLNAVGLSNPGAAAMNDEIREFKDRCDAGIIASIFGSTVEEFEAVAAIAAQSNPHLIEVNVSCPNVESEFGSPFGLDLESTCQITQRVKAAAGNIPVAVKLSPQAHHIGDFAKACEDHGADAINAINTVGPGMFIDINVRKPILSNRVGGLSGKAILPIAIRCVWDIYKRVSIPIIGTGGVSCAEGALQMILAGATAVGIGTGVYDRGIGVFDEVNQGLENYLQAHGLESINQIRGAAHG